MNPLAGELLAYPSPNRPGFWVYRKLANGTLLETELTREEWHALHDAAMAETNAKIDSMNQHPLNVAALTLLRRAGEVPFQLGALQQLHVLSLAQIALPNDSEGKEDQPPWSQFAALVSNVARMGAALRQLEDAGVESDDLLAREPADAARYILDELGIS